MFDELKNAIRNVIKENGKQEITGDILQDVLIAMLDAISEAGFVLMSKENPGFIIGTGIESNGKVYATPNYVPSSGTDYPAFLAEGFPALKIPCGGVSVSGDLSELVTVNEWLPNNEQDLVDVLMLWLKNKPTILLNTDEQAPEEYNTFIMCSYSNTGEIGGSGEVDCYGVSGTKKYLLQMVLDTAAGLTYNLIIDNL